MRASPRARRGPCHVRPPTSAWPRPGLYSVLGFDPHLSGPAERLGAERTLTGLKTHPHGARLLPATGRLLHWHGHGTRAHPGNWGDEEQSGRSSHSLTNPSDRQARAVSRGPAAASPGVQGSQAGQQ